MENIRPQTVVFHKSPKGHKQDIGTATKNSDFPENISQILDNYLRKVSFFDRL
jgi:hypothetical protein